MASPARACRPRPAPRTPTGRRCSVRRAGWSEWQVAKRIDRCGAVSGSASAAWYPPPQLQPSDQLRRKEPLLATAEAGDVDPQRPAIDAPFAEVESLPLVSLGV